MSNKTWATVGKAAITFLIWAVVFGLMLLLFWAIPGATNHLPDQDVNMYVQVAYMAQVVVNVCVAATLTGRIWT